jgi:TPR repeat protein
MLLEPTTASPPVAREPVRHHDPEPASPAPAYTGGIFNLGAPADKPYRNLDYLLEDDEPRSGKGFLVVGIVALALVAGLGYLRWRDGGFPALKAKTSSSQPATPTATNPTDSTSPSPAPDQQSPSATPSAQPNPTAPTSTGAPAPPSSAPSPAAAPATAAPNPTNASTPTTPAAVTDSNPAAAEPAPTPDATDSGTSAPAAATDKPATTPAASAPADAPPPKPKPATKPAPKPKPPDPVTLGEQYLYGRGVPQSCERGLRYVKPAADQANAKAMITMGALYATGHCLSRDLPTAYRFFALALRADPENGPLRQNTEMVWKQMTAEERKQAIRLTQ